jgi:hypothetical protein
MAELQQPWDSDNDLGLENLSDDTDIASVSEPESVYSATESDKNFIVDDYIAPEESDPSYSPSDSESSSSQSSGDIAGNYSVRHFVVCTRRQLILPVHYWGSLGGQHPCGKTPMDTRGTETTGLDPVLGG